MDRRTFLTASMVVAAGAAVPGVGLAAPQEMTLPKPETSGGKPLMVSLMNRRSERAFAPDPLPAQVLSNLLWAAWGVNRPEAGKHTAPSCRNWQEIDVYAVLKEGAFLYDAKRHVLVKTADKDLRPLTGKQEFVAGAPLNLVYVVDFAKMKGESEDLHKFFAGTDTGFISQNVYLFCASEGLATVVRANLDKPALAKALGLRPDQWITLAQTVGSPKR